MIDLSNAHDELREHCADVLKPVQWHELSDIFDKWLVSRKKSFADLFPVIGYYVAGGNDISAILPTCGFWALYLFAARLSDDIIDDEAHKWREISENKEGLLPPVLTLLSLANYSLSKQESDQKTLINILEIMGRSWALAAKAQKDVQDKSLNLEKYLQNMIATTSLTVAAGFGSGAMVATHDKEVVQALTEFGQFVGIANSIVSDCEDVNPKGPKKSDIELGIYKLPIIYAASLVDDNKNTLLMDELNQDSPDPKKVYSILQSLGAVQWSLNMAKSYQIKAKNVLKNEALDPSKTRMLTEFFK